MRQHIRHIGIFFTLLSLSSVALAGPNETVLFHKSLQTYFERFFGADAIVDHQYVREVPAELRWEKNGAGSIQDIDREIGYVLLKNNIICRVGLGYAWVSRFALYDDPNPAVFAECAPVYDDTLLNLNLETQFQLAKSGVLKTPVALPVSADGAVSDYDQHNSASIKISRGAAKLHPARLFFRSPRDLIPFQKFMLMSRSSFK